MPVKFHEPIIHYFRLIIKIRNFISRSSMKLTLLFAISVSSLITLTNSFQDIVVALNNLIPDSVLLMPGHYPGFCNYTLKGPVRFLNLYYLIPKKLK